MEQIKECPYCGETDILELKKFGEFYHVVCKCGAIGPGTTAHLDAILLWNAAANQIELRNAAANQIQACQYKIFELEKEIERLKIVVTETDDTAHKYYLNWQAELQRVEAGDKRQEKLEAEIEVLRNELAQFEQIMRDDYALLLQMIQQRDEARAWARKLYRDNQLKDGDIIRLCEELDKRPILKIARNVDATPPTITYHCNKKDDGTAEYQWVYDTHAGTGYVIRNDQP